MGMGIHAHDNTHGHGHMAARMYGVGFIWDSNSYARVQWVGGGTGPS